VNTDDLWPDLEEAEHRVLVMQKKLHRWAVADPGRRFDDLANLVYDPAFLVVAWDRVRVNKGARTAGVDGVAPRSSHSVPTALTELHRLGRTLKQRAGDVLAYFDRPGTSNGPTEAINGRLEHLRGSALGFRNLTNYIARSLLETGGFRPRLHPGL